MAAFEEEASRRGALTATLGTDDDSGMTSVAYVDLYGDVPRHRGAAGSWTRSSVPFLLADESCYLFVAVVGNGAVGSLHGYSLLHPNRRRPQFLLYEIDVKKDHRRRGVGGALVEAFVSEARASGACEVWVLTNDSNEAAVAMYRRCGFARLNPDDVMLNIALSLRVPSNKRLQPAARHVKVNRRG